MGELGSGGMAVVYRAKELSLHRWVAIKTPGPATVPTRDGLERFRAEAEAIGALQHPNIVQVYQTGYATNGLPYCVLELVDGGTLHDKCSGAPMRPREAAALVETIARVIHIAHEKGILHRDLKPANVLLTKDGVPKVSDFGLVRRVGQDSGLTQTGMIMGSPSYMAPEQARGDVRDMGRTVDVYGLGATLYAALTGRAPFIGGIQAETLRQVISTPPISPRSLQRDIPKDLETICLKCLEKNPAKRYASAHDLAEDLLSFLCDRTIRARPVGPIESTKRWCKRHPRAAIVAVASALFLTTISATSTAFAFRLERQRREVVQARERADEAARQAESGRKVAIDAMYALVVRIDHALGPRPDTLELRRALLEDALERLKSIPGTDGTDSFASRTLAAAYDHLGAVTLDLGKRRDARAWFEKSYALDKATLARAPADWWVNYNIGTAERRLAALERDPAKARAMLQGTLERYLMLDKTPLPGDGLPGAVPYALACTYSVLGDTAIRQDKPAEAKAFYKQGITAGLRIMPEADPSKRWNISADGDATSGSSNIVSRLYQALGDLATQQDHDLETALLEYHNAEAISAPWFTASPSNPFAQSTRAQLLYRIGATLQALNRRADSKKPLLESQALFTTLVKTDTKNSIARLSHALAKARCGSVAEASTLAAGMMDESRHNTLQGLDAWIAAIYAQCASAVADGRAPASLPAADKRVHDEYAAKAFEILRLLVLKRQIDASMLDGEAELAPLRGLPDFPALRAALAP